jgi:hypothetical protein
MSFVLASKTDKLKYLSSVIGFEAVNKCKEVLKKGLSHIRNKLKRKNFDDEISRRNGNLLQVLGETITSDEHFIKKINELIKDLDKTVQSFEDIDTVIEELKTIDDSPIIQERGYFQDIINKINDFKGRVQNLYNFYSEFLTVFQEIKGDVNSLKKIALNSIWQEGLKVLTQQGIWEEDICPLCEQKIDKETLTKSLRERLKNIRIIRDKKERLEATKNKIKNFLTAEINSLKTSIMNDKYFRNETKENLQELVNILDEYKINMEKELNKDILKETMKPLGDIKFPEIELDKVIEYCQQKHKFLEKALKGQKVLEIQDKMIRAKTDYEEIKNLKKEKEVLEKIYASIEKIYNAFVKEQKKEIENFVKSFSNEITTYYEYMHPGEPVRNFSITTIIDEDELKGITLEYEFLGQKVSPPQKYLSESHLNSLGIAFFLASVKAFNKINKFFILDDIISSFDLNHRARLSSLLLEHFRDYQLVILTHEKSWFEYMKHQVKGRHDWIINAVHWSEDRGTHLKESLTDLKTQIEIKIKNNEVDGLGNTIRKYLEGFLKEVCEEIEVHVKYLSNERNESRTAGELLSELKGSINRQPCKDRINSSIEKLIGSKFIADKDSHDDQVFSPNAGDIKALWDDVLDLYDKFYCKNCLKTISVKYFDNVNKKIRCKCGQLIYDWK